MVVSPAKKFVEAPMSEVQKRTNLAKRALTDFSDYIGVFSVEKGSEFQSYERLAEWLEDVVQTLSMISDPSDYEALKKKNDPSQIKSLVSQFFLAVASDDKEERLENACTNYSALAQKALGDLWMGFMQKKDTPQDELRRAIRTVTDFYRFAEAGISHYTPIDTPLSGSAIDHEHNI